MSPTDGFIAIKVILFLVATPIIFSVISKLMNLWEQINDPTYDFLYQKFDRAIESLGKKETVMYTKGAKEE